MRLLYGMDPLCGWCFGIGPAIRRVVTDHPEVEVVPVLAGLVDGARVGPYAAMVDYIRSASVRLAAVTGRAPSQAFFDLIARPGVIGDSAPPTVAIAAVRSTRPERVLDAALAITEAHFAEGADLNRPETYERIFATLGQPVALPDLGDRGLAAGEWAVGRALGLSTFPSLWFEVGNRRQAVPLDYDPGRLSATIGALGASHRFPGR